MFLVPYLFQLPLDQAAEAAKGSSIPVQFLDDEATAAFRKDSDSQRSSTVTSMREWLLAQEEAGLDVSALDFACHEVVPVIKKDAAGDVLGRMYQVSVKEQCVFVPAATPRKLNSGNPPTWEDAGSVVILKNLSAWNLLGNCCHQAGILKVVARWQCTANEQMQAITPEKPGIYLVCPVQLKAGVLVQLA